MADYRRENVKLVDDSDKQFTYSEQHRGRNRDIIITCNDDNSTVEYRATDGKGPLQQDANWYENNIKVFYDSLAKAIANAYIANGDNWDSTVEVRIHRTDYEYELYQ